MKVINLKEMYSDYYILKWKKQGLPLITERPPTTFDEVFEKFIMEGKKKKRSYKKISKKTANTGNLDWRDYIKEEYL